jgi:hypothetical protein
MEGLRGVDSRSLLVFRDCDIIYFTVLDAPGSVTPAIVNCKWLACDLVESRKPAGSVSAQLEKVTPHIVIRGAEARSP